MHQPPIDAKVDFLRSVPLFAAIDDKLLSLLAGIMKLERLAAGTILCRAGDPGDGCFVIGDGQVEVFAADAENGGERILSTLGPRSSVGEVALVDGKRRSASVRCKTDASIFSLRRDDFEQLLNAGNPASMKLLDNIAITLAQRVRTVNERFADIFANPEATIRDLSARLRSLQADIEVESRGHGVGMGR